MRLLKSEAFQKRNWRNVLLPFLFKLITEKFQFKICPQQVKWPSQISQHPLTFDLFRFISLRCDSKLIKLKCAHGLKARTLILTWNSAEASLPLTWKYSGVQKDSFLYRLEDRPQGMLQVSCSILTRLHQSWNRLKDVVAKLSREKKKKKNTTKRRRIWPRRRLYPTARQRKEKKRREREEEAARAVTQGVHAGSVVPMGSQVIIDQMSACPPPLHVRPPLPPSLYWCDSSDMTESENIFFCFVSTHSMFRLLRFVLPFLNRRCISLTGSDTQSWQ